jgi:hypothetical protein
MFLRLVRFTLTDAARAQAMAYDLIPRIKPQPGCAHAVCFGESDGASGIAVLWDSQQHADAAAAVIRPMLEQHLSGNVAGPPDARLFPVLAS